MTVNTIIETFPHEIHQTIEISDSYQKAEIFLFDLFCNQREIKTLTIDLLDENLNKVGLQVMTSIPMVESYFHVKNFADNREEILTKVGKFNIVRTKIESTIDSPNVKLWECHFTIPIKKYDLVKTYIDFNQLLISKSNIRELYLTKRFDAVNTTKTRFTDWVLKTAECIENKVETEIKWKMESVIYDSNPDLDKEWENR